MIRQAVSLRDGELALIFDCGYQDFFYQVNLNLHEQLMRQGVGHDFLVRPGAHNAAYWSASLPCQMLFFSALVRPECAPAGCDGFGAACGVYRRLDHRR